MRPQYVDISGTSVIAAGAVGLALALALAPMAQGQPEFDNTWHVDVSVVGGDENGANWANAFRYLQDALAAAANPATTDQIWVAAGTYYPDRNEVFPNGTGIRSESFALQNGVSIYGGFLGLNHPAHENGETGLLQRDPEVNITILSGDIDEDGLLDADNSLHVVTASEVVKTAVLNGFTISGGYADGFSDDARGGGILVVNGNPPLDAGPTVVRCRLSGNFADEGAGVHVTGPYAKPVLVNCSFISNDSREGGGMHLEFGSPQATLVNCLFVDNVATEHGGAIDVSGEVDIVNCTFLGNEASADPGVNFGGGAVWAEDGDVAIINSILWSNTPNEIEEQGGSAVVSYSDVQDGWAGIGNIDADPDFCDPSGGNLRLMDSSLCIDAGLSSAVPEDAGDVDDDGADDETLPWDGDTARPVTHYGRFFDVAAGPGAETAVDMGAYENQHISGCPWDIAGTAGAPPPDGDVGVTDFLKLLAEWAYCPGCGADFNCDLLVSVEDFLDLLAHWGPCPSSAAPEAGGAPLEVGLWLMGFTDLAAYEAWVSKATDAEVYVSAQVLGELLVLID